MKHAGWLLLVLVACAHNRSGSDATGKDGRIKGAKPVALENGQGTSRGIVTYPGGDRIDWRVLELPQGKHGKLDLQLTWQAPRPGLALAFDVFDEWHDVVFQPRARRPGGRTQTASIDNARGKYFVRIYAPRRTDAGEYKLVANFTGTVDDGPTKPVEVLDPPKLPAVPEPAPTCEPFDVSNKACRDSCPDFGAPQGWPGCAAKEKAAAEKAAREEAEKHKPPPPKPALARILHYEASSSGVKVTLGIGTDAVPGLDKSWQAQVLSKLTGNPLANGKLILVGVGKTQTMAMSTLTTDQLAANPQVRLTPPGSP